LEFGGNDVLGWVVMKEVSTASNLWAQECASMVSKMDLPALQGSDRGINLL
jgi:hypothetical protein